jgi:predicted transposase YdaD
LGLKQAREEAIKEGREEGRAKGWEEGRAEGRREGWEEGRTETEQKIRLEDLESAKKMKTWGVSPEKIRDILPRLSPEDIDRL